ncbi:DMT family transporter [Chroogloeocystis siderophila]|uniref:EamA domain-containing protein n=1 Tax=Chroogloeocystis siderophila 5.2 s.c.1 TaxID=247279 RepID=A0A1U7HDX8_9CHRO|nr:DMT family transporter [Chroogloeocystis siderophila]OKH21780.1 hypothetical protein NIES1031_21225 [Chroogloeocystis siderophila 5.2 s.c.1]
MEQFKLGSVSNTPQNLISNGFAAIVLGMALLGIAFASILTVVTQDEIGPNATTFNRLGIAAITFAGWNGFRFLGQIHAHSVSALVYTWRDRSLLAIAGTSFAASLTLWAWSLTQTSIANSTLLNNMMPIFTTLGAWLVLGQKFSARFVLGMAIAVCGAIAIGIEDFQGANSNLFGDSAALGAAMLAAVCLLSLEQLRLKFATPTIMQWTCLIGSLGVFPVILLTQEPLFPTSGVGWCTVISLAIVCQVVGQGLLTYSLAKFSSGLVAVSMLAIPAIAAVLALIIFAEKLSILNLCAFAVVLAGVYLAISARSN